MLVRDAYQTIPLYFQINGKHFNIITTLKPILLIMMINIADKSELSATYKQGFHLLIFQSFLEKFARKYLEIILEVVLK